MELALAHPRIESWLDRYPPDPSTDADYRADSRTWVVKAWSGEAGQVALAVVEDTSGRVTEAWTGPQVAWKMARGREGAFGGKTLLRPYVWLGFCLIFLVGLADLIVDLVESGATLKDNGLVERETIAPRDMSGDAQSGSSVIARR